MSEQNIHVRRQQEPISTSRQFQQWNIHHSLQLSVTLMRSDAQGARCQPTCTCCSWGVVNNSPQSLRSSTNYARVQPFERTLTSLPSSTAQPEPEEQCSLMTPSGSTVTLKPPNALVYKYIFLLLCFQESRVVLHFQLSLAFKELIISYFNFSRWQMTIHLIGENCDWMIFFKVDPDLPTPPL